MNKEKAKRLLHCIKRTRAVLLVALVLLLAWALYKTQAPAPNPPTPQHPQILPH